MIKISFLLIIFFEHVGAFCGGDKTPARPADWLGEYVGGGKRARTDESTSPAACTYSRTDIDVGEPLVEDGENIVQPSGKERPKFGIVDL
jgi:hypothetical protein